MKLRQLFENIYEQNGEEHDGSLKSIGVAFGRFNPPHRGHRAVWEAAATNPIWYIGTNQSTLGPKDPLPYDVKLQAMAAIWPKVAGHVIPEQSLLTLASSIYEKHGSNVHLKVYTDEEWLYKTLSQYNGVDGKSHGHYRFVQIDWVRTERVASATDLRSAVRGGNREEFYHDVGIKPSVTIEVEGQEYPVFDVVAHFLNQYPEAVKKTKKSAEFAEEAAGVGKITAQNTTCDVDASTPSKNLKAFTLIERYVGEAAYAGNLGMMELFKFFNDAQHNQPELVNTVKQLIADGEAKRVWKIVQSYTNTQLHGTEFNEELTEAGLKSKKITKRQQQSTRGLNTYSDSEHWNGDYTAYRLGMAVACTNGKNIPDIDPKSWIGKAKSTHPYTQEEQEMLKKAYKAAGAAYKDENHGDMRSLELDSTNKASPIAKLKRNKYGV